MMKSPTPAARLRGLILLIGFCLCPGLRAEEQARTMRVYLMGSSLTDSLGLSALEKMAESRGHQHIWGNQSIPGGSIRTQWGARDSRGGRKPFGGAGPALREHEWDAISLEPRNGYETDLEAALNFIDFATAKSPGIQVYVFSKWPRRRGGSFDKQWLSEAKDIQNNNRFGAESFLMDIRKARPNLQKTPLIAPVGHVYHLLDLKAAAGLIPGMTGIYDGYGDSSHQNSLGKFIASTTYFATLYRESPAGLPSEFHGKIEPKLARAIQETVWEGVNSTPLSGVKANEPLRVITPWFPAAVEGVPYRRELHAAFGEFPLRWRLTGGQLPKGVALHPDGFIEGTPQAVQETRPVFEVTDARGRTAQREVGLAVRPQSRPSIPEQPVPALVRGQRVSHQFIGEGGNGDLVWLFKGVWEKQEKDGQVVWNKLQRAGRVVNPQGFALTQQGVLEGSPGVEGTWKLLLHVEDSTPGKPNVAEREIMVTAAPAAPEVYFVPQGPERPTIDKQRQATMDGVLNEPFWKVDQPIGKVTLGKPELKARFGANWNNQVLYVAVEVEDPRIHEDSPEALWHDSSVEVFVDLDDTRENEYNANHKRVVATASGKALHLGVALDRCPVGVKRTEKGYVVEMAFHLPAAHRSKLHEVYAFDVAVNQDRDGGERDGQIVWRGEINNDVNPRSWGTLIMAETGWTRKAE